MKILLIYPLPLLSDDITIMPEDQWAPLGLSFIAGNLRKKGHSVSIFDRFAVAAVRERDNDKLNGLMLDHVRMFKPDLIGFNTVSPLIFDTVECAAIIRPYHTGPIIAGGHHATALPELTLHRIPELDLVIQGEGEVVLSRLADGEEPFSLPGVFWRKGGNVVGSAPEQITNLDSLPFPAMDMLDMDFYTRPVRTIGRGQRLSTISLITSRGCTRCCSFCTESLTYGNGVRMHSPEYVLAWMQQILSQFTVNAFYFHDNDFLADENRASEICKRMIDLGLHRRVKSIIQTRVDRLNKEVLALLKRAGCTLIELGIEAADQRELDSIGKETTVDQNERGVRMCQKAGISPHANMMFGFSGETVVDLEKRLEWLKKVKGDFTCTLHLLTIDPGTLIYRENGAAFFERNPWTREGLASYYRENHLSATTNKERTAWIKKRYLPWWRRKNRLAVLRRNPPLTALHLLIERLMRIINRYTGKNTSFQRPKKQKDIL